MNNIQAVHEIRRRKILTLVICVTVIIVIVVGVLIWDSNRRSLYSKAMALFNQHNYAEAISLFKELNGYRDSAERVQESHYQLGTKYLASGKYDSAKSEFDQAAEYSDAYTQANESVYQRATAYLKAGQYDKATLDYYSISGYKDADTMVKESQYKKAKVLTEAGEYDSAYEIYANLSGYRDVESIMTSINRKRKEAFVEQFSIGNTVFLGSYEQDNNEYNGEEPIEWIVLDTEDTKRLLISRYGIVRKEFDDEERRISWEECTLRDWLNNNFIFTAFTENEIKGIVNTQCGNGFGNKAITTDRVFLLSVEEVEHYFPYEEDKIAYVTVPCLIFPSGTVGYSEYGSNPSPSVFSWWTRTCSSNDDPMAILENGEIDDCPWPTTELCVRPVVWVDISKVGFS